MSAARSDRAIEGLPDSLRERAITRLEDLLERAQSELMIRGSPPLPRPELRFYDHRLDAGRATPSPQPGEAGTLEINAAYLARHPEEMLRETIAHELAHLIVFHLHPRRRQPPHGALWSGIMRDWFSVEPERTHRFDASVTAARRQRRWRYRCACREHALTTVRHKRAEAGARYLCRACNGTLQWTGEEA